MKRCSELWAVSLFLLASGCMRTDVPDGLHSPEDALRQSRGALVLARMDTCEVDGELISVETDTLFLICKDSLCAIPKGHIREAKVFLQEYPLSGGGVAAWTLLGTLSTLSNGWGSILTAPLWLLTGTITGISAAHSANSGDFQYPDDPWPGLAKFARFPQGLLPGIPREQLKGAEVRVPPKATVDKKAREGAFPDWR